MSDIIPFQFETHAVRAQIDTAGLPWFNANDVCLALGLANPRQAVKSHVDADDVQKLDTIDDLGRSQQINHVNESGLYGLIFGSAKESAKRFKRWVTHDVLPTLRKTGHYAVSGGAPALPAQTQDTVGALLLVGQALAKTPGVKPGIAFAATLTCIQENTGLALESLRRSLPANDEPICALNATQLGKLLGRSAKATNQRLAANGLQVRNDRDEWELTDAGGDWAEALPFSRNGHSGYQLLWNPAVIDQLREVA